MDFTLADRERVLRNLAWRWTEIALNLESGQEALPSRTAEDVLGNLLTKWAHPLLTPENALHLMSGLHAAQMTLNAYLHEGTLPDDDYLLALSREDMTVELYKDVDTALMRLLYASEPCTACLREFSDWKAWNPQPLDSGLCDMHKAASLEVVR